VLSSWQRNTFFPPFHTGMKYQVFSLLPSLQAGQYTSIFVDNSAGAPVTIQNGSDFMGMLMGA